MDICINMYIFIHFFSWYVYELRNLETYELLQTHLIYTSGNKYGTTLTKEPLLQLWVVHFDNQLKTDLKTGGSELSDLYCRFIDVDSNIKNTTEDEHR